MKVSIIVPCYNQAEYIEDCLTSVINQTYTNWECIVVNDGGKDNVEAVMKKWTAQDSRISFISTTNKGVSHARNIGIKSTSGQFILPLDADDKIASNYLYLAIEAYKNQPDLTLVYCKAETFGTITGPWELKPFSLKALAVDNIIFCSAIYKRSDWELLNGYDESLIKGLEDWEFWIALLKTGGKVLQLESTCFYYRIKSVSRQQQLNPNNKIPIYKYISIKHADFFVSQLGDFQTLYGNYIKAKNESYKSLKNKKKAIDVFTKTCFGFSIFKTF